MSAPFISLRHNANWQFGDTAPGISTSVNRVRYAEGVYVMVGEGGEIWWSDSARTDDWTLRLSELTVPLVEILAVGEGVWIAIGNPQGVTAKPFVSLSTNGGWDWNATAVITNDQITGAAITLGGMIVVGPSVCYFTDDFYAAAYTPRPAPWGAKGVVMCGPVGGYTYVVSQGGGGEIYRTNDNGATWETVFTTGYDIYCLSRVGGQFMAGSAGVIFTSPNGNAGTWGAHTITANLGILDISGDANDAYLAGLGGTASLVYMNPTTYANQGVSTFGGATLRTVSVSPKVITIGGNDGAVRRSARLLRATAYATAEDRAAGTNPKGSTTEAYEDLPKRFLIEVSP